MCFYFVSVPREERSSKNIIEIEKKKGKQKRELVDGCAL